MGRKLIQCFHCSEMFFQNAAGKHGQGDRWTLGQERPRNSEVLTKPQKSCSVSAPVNCSSPSLSVT